MTHLLIIDDQPKDLRAASDTAQSLGFTTIESRSSAMAAKLLLEKGLDGERPLPDVIVLDLDLGYESGFELMRYWHSNARLAAIPIIVWTILGEEQREICRLFKVTAYIFKSDDVRPLKEALAGLVRSAS